MLGNYDAEQPVKIGRDRDVTIRECAKMVVSAIGYRVADSRCRHAPHWLNATWLRGLRSHQRVSLKAGSESLREANVNALDIRFSRSRFVNQSGDCALVHDSKSFITVFYSH
jgi:hypothetical protein